MRVHAIYRDLEYIEDIPYVADHPNQGLPDSFFESQNDWNIEIDSETHRAEWWPGIGPNHPIVIEGGADLPRDELGRRMHKLVEEMF